MRKDLTLGELQVLPAKNLNRSVLHACTADTCTRAAVLVVLMLQEPSVKHLADAKTLSAVWFSQQKCTGFFLTYMCVMTRGDCSLQSCV